MPEVRFPELAKGSEIGILFVITMNPDWPDKRVARFLRYSERRVQQVTNKYSSWVVNTRNEAHCAQALP